ncbi:MAG: biotin--[acetyl-CoA-carboxylase] ligase [Chlamydiales bacterium]
MELIHHHFETISSTNDWAKAHMASFGQKELTLVTADTQEAGRGQYGRVWISPPQKNFYGTFSFFIDNNLNDAISITHVMAISLVHLLLEFDLSAQVKWPNDVLIAGKKIAGILCETIPTEKKTGIILGVGFNINMEKEDFDSLGHPATSLLLEKGKRFSLPQINDRLLELFRFDLATYLEKGFFPFLPYFRKYIFIPDCKSVG